MIQPKQSRKVKGARKKERDQLVDRLTAKFPTWFDNKSIKEIRTLCMAFKNSGMGDDEFPTFCIEYEMGQDREKVYNK